MRPLPRRHAVRLVALLGCAAVFAATVEPQPSAAERDALAGRFSFTHHPVGPADRPGARHLRSVAPAYERIRSWISSLGAGAGLFAADGGTASHDLCLVDPRTDAVSVAPAPTTGARYPAFPLVPGGAEPPPSTAPMGCLPVDFDEDGWQDVVVYYWGRSPVLFRRTPGVPPSAAAFSARELVSPRQVWNTNAATTGDFDGDGHLDLVFGNYFPDGVRVLDPSAGSPGPVMNDSLSNAANGGTLRLFRSAGGGRFTEARDAFAPADRTGWTLALGAQDLDGDGLPELYVANDFGSDRLLVNGSAPGRVAFTPAGGVRHATTPKSKVLGDDSFKGMGVAFTDLLGTGVPAILVSNITEPYALQESNFAFVATVARTAVADRLRHGVAPYDDRSESLGLSRSGWSWDVKAADFDNTGSDEVMHATGFVAGTENGWARLQELAMANDLVVGHPGLWPTFTDGVDLSGHDRNTFFVRGPDGRFVDVAGRLGVDSSAVSRAFAVGDVDSDGRLDFVVANQWARSTLYRNTSPAGSFLGLRLRLPTGADRCVAGAGGPTTPAIGAEAQVSTPDGGAGVAQLYPANGHNGVNAADLHFGLGAHPAAAVPVRLTWRDGCGHRHTGSVSLTPGWHVLRLGPDGSVREDW
ncbi:ASPIC/UnbV protein [Saccharothrix saharensis]|uniref:ASPIC/UnbV protein n=1 Tax=Saccharothrix saharensis TaxID=571190 RepID=A0A543JNL7_9PSEU|nr:CRTAC1 family protein [Saccharothrix saharensis]TQM84432.1 ASPIC/UnbV protein [Saccharothrix saharensis]